jgi:hypothetical protein
MPSWPPFSEAELREAVAGATCWADTLRLLGYEVKGANHRTVQRWAVRWNIPTGHFDPNIARRRSSKARATPLEQALVENSSYPRGALKERLFASGLKQRACEMCGQDELWEGHRMSLVLDHINGISNDHRFENLRIVCPNCAATLETHCSRNLPPSESARDAGSRLRHGTSDIGTARRSAGERCSVTGCEALPSQPDGRCPDPRPNS